jgi:hypothetical protein
MRNVHLIPRKDHEVYFIEINAGMPQRKRYLERFIGERLSLLHPGYTASFATDIKRIETGGRKWLMVTVMSSSLLREYRLLYPRAKLSTASSSFFSKPDFGKDEPRQFLDEIIGFSKEKNEPVSYQIFDQNAPSDDLRLEPDTGYLNGRAYVFTESVKKPAMIALSALLLLLIGLSVAFIGTGTILNGAKEKSHSLQPESPQKEFLPDTLDLLDIFSSKVIVLGAIADRFEYSETAERPFVFLLRNSAAVTACAAMNSIGGLVFIESSSIEYVNAEPSFSLYYGLDAAKYRFHEGDGFTDNIEAIGFYEDFRGDVLKTGAVVTVGAIRQSGHHAFLSSAEIRAADIGVFLKCVKAFLVKRNARLTLCVVTAQHESGMIHVEYAFAKMKDPIGEPIEQSAFSNVVKAFGFSESSVNLSSKKQNKKKPSVDLTGYKMIGKIAQDDGTILLYYQNDAGKIITQEESK